MNGVISLEPIVWSSEEDEFPASSLTTAECVQRLQQLNDGDEASLRDAGWQSEKFCEYPQTIVFRLNRGAPIVLSKLLILSHHVKIPSRIEIFVAMPSASGTSVTNWKSARFERLGFVAFLNSLPGAAVRARELKSVPMPSTPVAFIKFFVHSSASSSCSRSRGIATTSNSTTTMIGGSHNGRSRSPRALRCPSLSPTAKRDAAIASFSPDAKAPARLRHAFPSSPTLSFPSSSSSSSTSPFSAAEIWLPERQTFASPTQILTRLQLSRARAEMRLAERTTVKLVVGPEDLVLRAWRVDELECQTLCERLQRLQATSTALAASHDRLVLRNEMNAIVDALRALDEKNSAREREFQQLGVAFPGKACLSSGAVDEWQTREEFLWSVNDALRRLVPQTSKQRKEETTTRRTRQDVEEIAEEALQIATTALEDAHPQVFVAASTLLATVLQSHPLFQETTAWKHEVTTLVALLLRRLDDAQPVIRNNAAFALVKIAELTKARGTFVMHTLLQSLETPQNADLASAQRLYGLLKVLTALLLGFHCCATIDIAPKRVLACCCAATHVGSAVILEYLRTRKKPPFALPESVLRSIEELLASVEQRAG
ncbi:hypothetical protein PINS_up002217 [Pythium insidiosum]|nr:hypothetical protein PINS_up002217 [Pythium insidiosum]